MPHSAIQLYLEQLQKRQAELRLLLGEAATVPHMDEEGRRNWTREINEVLHSERKAQTVSSPEMLRAIGIGFHKE